MSDSHLKNSSSAQGALSSAESRHATELIVVASRFVRAASRHSGRERSTIVLRTLSNLSLVGPMRIGDLASAEHITQPTMTGVLKRLEVEGLVKRQADPYDGRAQLIEITPSGKKELNDFRKKATQRIQPAVARLTSEERKILWRASEILGSINKDLDDL
ncbi:MULTISPECIES: MarR family winged helix-turn-helix transcriptional regulator [Micrococcaceae]|uniref:MarR family winged helix-turn-helix transcriptional regulator n=1 Tax=unclassified Kocuria TaxID=2649579 RepID=UPI00101034F5|nr:MULTISPECIES: MarR family transcriptional regulator [unclassified Kocuria]